MNAVLRIDDQDFTPPLLTGEDVMAMTRIGVLPEGRGYELIEGVLVKMASQYGPHVGMVWKISRFLARNLSDDVDVSLGGSIFLAPTVMLEPDVCIFPAGMASHDVRGPDILLAIEISDSTLRYDLGKKADLYAAHGVTHYWAVDLNGEQIFVHTQPTEEGYGARAVHAFGTSLPIPFAPSVSLTI